MIRGILFDYGNTLVHIKDGETVLKDILAQMGHNVEPNEVLIGMETFWEYWEEVYAKRPKGERWNEKIRLDCIRSALERMGFTKGVERLAREVVSRWAAHERQGPYEDVKPALRTLEEMGIKLGVLSQNLMTGRELKEDLDARLIAGYFSTVLTSEDIGYDKPDPRFFERGCEAISLKNEELWYIGNRYHEDVVGARNAGMTPVLVERGKRRHKSRDCLAVTDLLSLSSMLNNSTEPVN